MSQFSVLIVDDDEVDRYLLKRDLKSAGLEVTFFEKSNGQEALKFFRDYDSNREAYPNAFPPLVTFLDINMPILGGVEFLEQFDEIRKELDVSTCIVMMFSTSEAEQDRENALKYDFVTEYLVKGKFDKADLRTLLLGLV